MLNIKPGQKWRTTGGFDAVVVKPLMVDTADDGARFSVECGGEHFPVDGNGTPTPGSPYFGVSGYTLSYLLQEDNLSREPNIKDKPVRAGTNALDIQIGGSHYRDMVIQPVEFIHKNGIGFIPGNVIKYVCRADKKGGIEDLKKARHYIDLLIEFEDGKGL